MMNSDTILFALGKMADEVYDGLYRSYIPILGSMDLMCPILWSYQGKGVKYLTVIFIKLRRLHKIIEADASQFCRLLECLCDGLPATLINVYVDGLLLLF